MYLYIFHAIQAHPKHFCNDELFNVMLKFFSSLTCLPNPKIQYITKEKEMSFYF